MPLKRKKNCSSWFTMEELLANTRRNVAGCFVWLRSSDRNGYAQARRNKRLYILSRIVMHLTKDFDLNSAAVVMHTCDNPRCLNPAHLVRGTYAANNRDKVIKGRQYKGSNHWKASLNTAKVRRIRQLKKRGLSDIEISKKFNVTDSAIYGIVNNLTWKHVK